MTFTAPNNDSNTGMAKKPYPARLIYLSWICAACMAMAITTSAHAELTPLENTDLDTVWGSAGITITPKNIQIFHHIDRIRYTGSSSGDSGYIEFQDFQMGGDGDVARFNYDFGTVTKSGMMFFDVAEVEVAPPVYDWSGYAFGTSDTIHRGMTLLNVPDWDQELSYKIGNIAFFDPNYPTAGTAAPVDLGSFYMGLIDMPRFYYYTSVPINGTGFDFQFNFQMTIDKIAYAYNDSCDTIEIGPTYIGGSFADLAGDDPRFPSTWKPNQASPVDFGEFQIGDLFGDISTGEYSNPAAINVGECDLDGTGPDPVLGALQLTLPMKGSIRFESAEFDGIDFGPGAIDGIQVHRLNLFLIPD